MAETIRFSPVGSACDFFLSPEMVSFIVGPVGSTKTSTSIMKVAYEAKRMARGRDGVRRSRCAIVRNTVQQLRDTTIPDFLKWYPDGVAGAYHKTDSKFVLKFDDVECEILFRGLDDANDVRRLLSLQLSFAMLDEVREISPAIFNALTGRIGRYPDKLLVPHRKEWGVDEKGNPIAGCVDDYGCKMKKIWGATNPPDGDTFWHKMLSEPPTGWHVSIQPSGLSQEADWIHLLDSGYYEDLIIGKTEEWIDVYVHGKWGRSLSGKPVFQSFKRDYHVSKGPLMPIRSEIRPLIIGMDFGLNPSVTVNQLDMFGRLMTFAVETSDGMGVTRFIQTRLKPLLSTRFTGMRCIVVGDPAGVQRSQTDERSCFDILRKEGFTVVPARTNALGARIAAVDKFLTRQIDGKPAHLIDPSCKQLISALNNDYRYKIKKNGELENEPDKTGYASHICDAHQYACLLADAGGGSMAANASMYGGYRREIEPVSSFGWT